MATESLKRSAPGTRVLVIDDETRLREMLSRSAAEMGFDPVPARSAEQALKILDAEDGAIDVILLDLNLPGMGGLELLEQLRQRWPQTQVIILTGFGSLAAARKAIRLDAADFLTKPCPLEDLEIALAKARRRRLESLGAGDASDAQMPGPAPVASPAGSQPMTLDELERVHILAALDRHDGNRAAAAAELGISERTLYYRLGQYQRTQRGE